MESRRQARTGRWTGKLRSRTKVAGARARALLSLLRVFLTPEARATSLMRTCEHLASAHHSTLPKSSLKELLAEFESAVGSAPERVVLHPLLMGPGSGSVAELAAISMLCAAVRPRCILEFGAHMGYSTWHLRANSSPETAIFTLDLPPGTTVSGSTDPFLQGPAARPHLPRDPNTHLIEIDSREWRPELPFPVDFCFIDAGHSYECVKNDTEKALALLSARGIIVWHDATWRHDGYEVWRYVGNLNVPGKRVAQVTLSAEDYCGIAVLLPSAASGIPSPQDRR